MRSATTLWRNRRSGWELINNHQRRLLQDESLSLVNPNKNSICATYEGIEEIFNFLLCLTRLHKSTYLNTIGVKTIRNIIDKDKDIIPLMKAVIKYIEAKTATTNQPIGDKICIRDTPFVAGLCVNKTDDTYTYENTHSGFTQSVPKNAIVEKLIKTELKDHASGVAVAINAHRMPIIIVGEYLQYVIDFVYYHEITKLEEEEE